MNIESEEKVNKTLDSIQKDRLRADDPFFATRMMARAESAFDFPLKGRTFFAFSNKLRPLFAAALILVGMAAGIILGTQMSRREAAASTGDRSSRIQAFAQEDFLNEINGSLEQKLLSIEQP